MYMVKKKPTEKMRKPLQVRLHPVMRQQLDKLAERNASDISTEVRSAIREYLKANELWPPEGSP